MLPISEIVCFVIGILLVIISFVIFNEMSKDKSINYPVSIAMIAIICTLFGPMCCVLSVMDHVESKNISKEIPTSIAVYRNQTELKINTHILNGDTISNDTTVVWKDEYKPYK